MLTNNGQTSEGPTGDEALVRVVLQYVQNFPLIACQIRSQLAELLELMKDSGADWTNTWRALVSVPLQGEVFTPAIEKVTNSR